MMEGLAAPVFSWGILSLISLRQLSIINNQILTKMVVELRLLSSPLVLLPPDESRPTPCFALESNRSDIDGICCTNVFEIEHLRRNQRQYFKRGSEFLNSEPLTAGTIDRSMVLLSFLHIIFFQKAIHSSAFFGELLLSCIKRMRIGTYLHFQ